MSGTKPSAKVRGKQAQQKLVAREAVFEAVSETESDATHYQPKKVTKKAAKGKKIRKSRTSNVATAGRSKRAVPRTAFAEALHSLAEATTAVKKWIGENVSQDIQETRELQESTSKIASLLRSKTSPEAASRSEKNASSITELDEEMVFRNGYQSFMIHQAKDIVHCEYPYHPSKTVASFRMKGASQAQMYAISGYTPCAKGHRLVLDSEFWTEEVKKVGVYHDFSFRSGGWHVVNGGELEDAFASHAENQAMLAAAYFLLQKYTGKEASKGTLWMLKDLLQEFSLPKEVEIYVSDRPCSGCRNFQEFLEQYTGIKITIVLMKNVGVMEKVKDARGNRKFPQSASDGFAMDDSRAQMPGAEVAQILMDRLKTNNEYLRKEIQRLSNGARKIEATKDISSHSHSSTQTAVVIPSKPTIALPKASEKTAKNSAPIAIRSKAITVVLPITPERRAKVTAASMDSRKRLYSYQEDWESEYLPPGRKSPKRRALHQTGGLLTPQHSQKDLDALDATEQRLHKRKMISETWLYRK